MDLPQLSYISPIEWAWCVMVVVGIVLNAGYLRSSAHLTRDHERANAPASVVEAARGRRERDTWRLAIQLLFVWPTWLAITSPNGPLTWRYVMFVGSFVSVEAICVLLAVRDAVRTNRIAALRLQEQAG